MTQGLLSIQDSFTLMSHWFIFFPLNIVQQNKKKLNKIWRYGWLCPHINSSMSFSINGPHMLLRNSFLQKRAKAKLKSP